MALEHRIRTSIDAARAELTARVDDAVRKIVDEMVQTALAEQEIAVREARQGAMADADAQARQLVEAQTNQRVNEAIAAAESRMNAALADADTEAARRLEETLRLARAREREAEMAALTRLLDSVRALDAARSLGEVLDALGQAAGREASRAAVLVLRHDRLLGWKLSGFGERDAQPKAIDLGLSESGVIGLAVGTARPITTRDSQTAADGPRFVHLPADRMGFAVPVIVGGRVVAAVYADGCGPDGQEHEVPSSWPEVVELLARHAARCLEALTVQKAAATPSPRFWVPAGAQAQGAAAPRASNSASSSGTTTEPEVSPTGVRA
jgi:hypothetical protein